MYMTYLYKFNKTTIKNENDKQIISRKITIKKQFHKRFT